ncbi:7926_t:CDS:2, partial [Cetraspora pellucida]
VLADNDGVLHDCDNNILLNAKASSNISFDVLLSSNMLLDALALSNISK